MSDSVLPRDADIAARLTADYRPSGLLVANCLYNTPAALNRLVALSIRLRLKSDNPYPESLRFGVVRTLLLHSGFFITVKLGRGANSRAMRLGPVRVVHYFIDITLF